jgi:hypothetical protein
MQSQSKSRDSLRHLVRQSRIRALLRAVRGTRSPNRVRPVARHSSLPTRYLRNQSLAKHNRKPIQLVENKKQYPKSIANFGPLLAMRAASPCRRIANRQPRNAHRSISNRNRPGFRNSAIPWKQTRNDFLTATKSPMSQNLPGLRVQGWRRFTRLTDRKSRNADQ